MRRTRSLGELLAPVVLVVAAGVVGSLFARETEIYFISALVSVAIVVSLFVFVGNSGVVSFGHISFVAVGAWAAGVLSIPVEEKAGILPNLFPFLRDTTVGNIPSLADRSRRGGRVRLRRRPPADATFRPRGGDCDVRSARDHPQRPALLREDRARHGCLLVGARDDRAAAGYSRRRDRGRRRLRLHEEPTRAAAARDA